MDIEKYYIQKGKHLSFSREQASMFAKKEAGDFNPIHDVGARRFCVPGDLLFSVALHCLGIYQSMKFEFERVVTDAQELLIVNDGDTICFRDVTGRVYLRVVVNGEKVAAGSSANELSRAYIEFSGVTFPYLLVDLLRDNEVMINPSRPLVMYKSMSFTLDNFEYGGLSLKYNGGSLRVDGKKANVDLPFGIHNSNGALVGHGGKEMLLGGLRHYDDGLMDELVANYNQIKESYTVGY